VSATWRAVLLLSLLSCLTTCLGVALALVVRESARAIAAGIGFSVGIMIVISAAELLPAAIADIGAGAALAATALGAVLVWGAHAVVPHVHLVKEAGMMDVRLIRSSYLVVFGLILHDVPEGFAMAHAYVASPALGVLVGVAIALHNLPEEFVMAVPAVLLRSKGFLFGSALLSALAEPTGAAIGLLVVEAAPTANAHFMAFAAGAMLFVSVHELVPLAKHYGHLGSSLVGTGIGALAYALLAAGIPRVVGHALP